MQRVRLPYLVVLVVCVAAAIVGEHLKGSQVRVRLAGQMAHALAFSDSLTFVTRGAETPASVSSEAAVALGYLERLRLGLGSPFRLIDYALADARLSDSTRRQVAWALLAHARGGDAYRVPAAALDYMGSADAERRPGLGRAHLALIDSVVGAAEDPRGGELTVRLAYALAAAEGSVGRWGLVLSARAAALARDRRMAQADARALLRAAGAAQGDPITLVPSWRAARRFQVERPALEPLPSAVEDAAVEAAPRVAALVRAVGAHASGAAASAAPGAPGSRAAGGRGEAPMLGPAAARRLAELPSVRGAPPQAPVVVAVRGYRGRILRPALAPEQDAARERFVASARNEEALAAEYALLVGGDDGAAPALAVLWAAVSLRAYGQEAVWLPGHPAPSVPELKARFGLAAVSFDADVPPAWRPYYLRMLASAAVDLQRALPSLSLRGLGVHFGESAADAAALALHDPRTRTIYLPVASGAGAIAHELAHDLDWQLGRARYAMRGDYSTDRAVREQRDALATSLRGLTAAALIPPMPENGYRPPHAQRPAEVFARSADWFVAVALAREGRTNGYLTAVQDELLTGYAAVTPPDVSGEGGQAVVSILEEMTFLDAAARAAFLARYGRGRALTAYDLVRRVLDAPAPGAGPDRPPGPPPLARPLLAFRAGAAPDQAAECEEAGALADDRPAAARRRLVLLAVEARARRLVHAREAYGSESWTARALGGAPWSPALVDTAVLRVRNTLLAQLRDLDAARGISAALSPLASAEECRPQSAAADD